MTNNSGRRVVAPPEDMAEIASVVESGAALPPSQVAGMPYDDYKRQQAEKVRENRLRRAADRQGLILRRSRRRDPRAVDFGTYSLVDANTNTLVSGDPGSGYGLSLDEVAKALAE